MKEYKDMSGVVLECECSLHLLRVENDKEDNLWYLSIYSYGGAMVYGFWKRIKSAMKLLWTGKMFSDQVVLDNSQVKQLIDFLNKNINKMKMNRDENDERSVATKDK